jgi:isovaleryl-CoA dehydrogenase
MRGSNTSEILFENCVIPKENLVGKEGDGVYILMTGLDYERVVLSGGPLGLMQAALDAVIPYVQERKQFDERLANFQLIQATVADMYTALVASRSLVHSAAKACDANPRSNKRDCAASILFSAENATQVALKAIQLLGGNGYINDYPTGRILRDAKLYEIGAGTSEIRRLLIGNFTLNF